MTAHTRSNGLSDIPGGWYCGAHKDCRSGVCAMSDFNSYQRLIAVKRQRRKK